MNNAVTLSEDMDFDYTIEDIVLRYSGRGMNLLQQHLEGDYCRRAAGKILALDRGNVFLTTGFYVSGTAETDGPPGTVTLALALKSLGFHPVIITDRICSGLFEPEALEVVYVSVEDDSRTYQQLLDRYRPVCLISIERCGRNLEDDYANMRGISIAGQTAQIDVMFQLASRRNILTVGIGDGGNEIGMGNLKDIIAAQLELNPCTVCVDELIVATTSNWGAYALAAYLSVLARRPVLLPYRHVASFLNRIVAQGCVDGVTRKPEPSVDGFAPDIEREILGTLNLIASAMI